MDINKKIKKLLSLNDNSIRSYSKFIKKNFGSINYKYNGDSLLHLIVSSDYACSHDNLINCIKKLIVLGINPNVKDDLGRTFLQRSLMVYSRGLRLLVDILSDTEFFVKYININSTDKNGNTLVHRVILTFLGSMEENRIVNFTALLIQRYNFDVFKKNKKGETILTCFKNILKDFEQHKMMAEERKLILNNLTIVCFADKANNFVKFVLESSESDLLNYLNYNFDNPAIALFICQTGFPENYEVVGQTLECIKKLLSVGCDPSLLINNRNFVADALTKRYPVMYLQKVWDLASQLGLNINSGDSLMRLSMQEDMLLKDIVDIYVMVSKYGYNDLNEDIAKLSLGMSYGYNALYESITKLPPYHFLPSQQPIDKTKFDYMDIRLKGFNIMFNNAFKKLGFSNEFILNDKTVEMIVDIIIKYNEILDIWNDYQFIQSFCNFMVEKYRNNITFNETVSDKWILENLKDYLVEVFENYVSKKFTLVKESEMHE